MDAELEFAIQPNTTGKQLFDQVTYLYLYVCMYMPVYVYSHIILRLLKQSLIKQHCYPVYSCVF